MTHSAQEAEGASQEHYPFRLALTSAVLFVIGIHSALFAGIPSPTPTNIGQWTFSVVFSGISLKWLTFFSYPLVFMTRTIAGKDGNEPFETDTASSQDNNRVIRALLIGPAIFFAPLLAASGPRATAVIILGGFLAYYAPFLCRYGKAVMYVTPVIWLPLGWLWGGFIDLGSREYDCKVGAEISHASGYTYPCQSVLFLRNYDVAIIRHGDEAIAADLKFLDDASLSRALRK